MFTSAKCTEPVSSIYKICNGGAILQRDFYDSISASQSVLPTGSNCFPSENQPPQFSEYLLSLKHSTSPHLCLCSLPCIFYLLKLFSFSSNVIYFRKTSLIPSVNINHLLPLPSHSALFHLTDQVSQPEPCLAVYLFVFSSKLISYFCVCDPVLSKGPYIKDALYKCCAKSLQ